MAKFKNISPRGDIEVPLLDRVVKAGETFEVDDPADAARFAEQPGNYKPVQEPKAASKPARKPATPRVKTTDTAAAPAAPASADQEDAK
ncbi:MAG TPA: hypothetical protein VGC45_15755 [Gryllotalpicola sp.]